MKKTLLAILLILFIPALAWAPPGGVGNLLPKWGDDGTYLYPIPADRGVAINGTGPSTANAYIDSQGNASFASLAGAGAGDVTGVGDCTDGNCLDGSSDGGTYIDLYGSGSYLKFENTSTTTDYRLTTSGGLLYIDQYASGITTATHILQFNPPYGSIGSMLTLNQSTLGPSAMVFYEDQDNGNGYVRLQSPSYIGGSTVVATLPSATGTLLTSTNIGSSVQAYDAQLTDLADGTISGDFVNTAYPWADNEVADDITAGNVGGYAFSDMTNTFVCTVNTATSKVNCDTDPATLGGGGGGTGAQSAFNTFVMTDATSSVADTSTDTQTWVGVGLSTSANADTITFTVDTASTSQAGIAELATTAETTTGTDTGRVVTPGGLEDGFDGSTNIVTVGTISSGAWNADAIPIGNGGTGSALTDPNDDRIGFWDDSAGAFAWLDLGSGLTITGTSISASTSTAGLTALDDIGDPDSSGAVNLTNYSWTIQTPNGNFVFGTDGSFQAESFVSGADTHVVTAANANGAVDGTFVAANYSGQMPLFADTTNEKYYYYLTDDSSLMEVAAIDSNGQMTIEDSSPSIKLDDSTASSHDWDIYLDGGILNIRDYPSGASTVSGTSGVGIQIGRGTTNAGYFIGINGDSDGPAYLTLEEANGTDYAVITAPSSLTSSISVTIPSSSGTLALTTDNVATATALAANGGNCNAGEIALGVDASGAVEGCYEPAFPDVTGSLAAGQLPSVTLTDSDIGVTVQAYDAQLDDLADGTISGNFVNTAYPWSVNEGGTGAATLTNGGVLLGSDTGAITAMSVLADGEMIVGDGTTDPVAESGATLRTSIGVGTADDVQFHDITSSNDTPEYVLTDTSAGDEDYSINATADVLYFDNTDVNGGTVTHVMQLTKTEVQNNVALDQNGAADFADAVVLNGVTTISSATPELRFTDSSAGENDYRAYLDSDTLSVNNRSDGGSTTQYTWQFQSDGDFAVLNGNLYLYGSIDLGDTDDSTIARASAGDISVEGNIVYRAGGTDVPVADGGTGASTAAAARANLEAAPPMFYWTIAGTAATDTGTEYPLAQMPVAITATNISCITDTGSVIIELQEGDSTSFIGGATLDAPITCDADGAADDGSLSNGTIDATDWASARIGTVTGSPTMVGITMYYTVD